MRLPFEIHKSKHLEKGTVIHILTEQIGAFLTGTE
jgi:hypothetical protein